MGVELLNNFAEGLYCDSTSTVYGFQTNLFAENDTVIAERENEDVKHTLKNKVIERLKSRGLDNISADFTPRPSYPMTKKEIEKDKRRRQSNRKSAQRSREKQKKEDETNKNLLVYLKKQQKQLLTTVKKFEEEKNKLLFKLKNVIPDSYILDALCKIKNVANNKKDITGQSKEEESAQTIVATDQTVTEDCIFEESCPESEFFLSPIHSVSGNERHVNGLIECLEIGNEKRVQFLDANFAAVTNLDEQLCQLEEQQIVDQNFTLLDLNIIPCYR